MLFTSRKAEMEVPLMDLNDECRNVCKYKPHGSAEFNDPEMTRKRSCHVPSISAQLLAGLIFETSA